MRFEMQAHPEEVAAFLTQLIEIPGAAAWVQRGRDFDAQTAANPPMGRYFDMQFTLEREMIRAKHHKQNTGRWPSAKTNNRSEFAHLCAFAGMVSNVFARLPPLGRNRLRNQIRGGLKDGRGLAPLAFEMRTAAHALRRGLDVTFHDLCEGGGYDFLVKGSGIEFEVECKSVSVDLGRPIHLHRQYQLGGRIYARMRSAQSPGLVKVLVATLPSRLYPKHEFMESVAKRIGHALDQCADLNDLQPCSVSYSELPIMGTPFGRASASEIDEASVSDYFSGLLGYHVDHALTTFSPSHSAVVVVLRSLQSNELLGGMYHALKDAAKYQLTASRPGMVFMQLRNLTSTQLRELVKQQSEPPLPNGLRVVTTRLFRGDARNHVHTVAYVAPGNFVRHQSLIEDRDGRRVETQITEDAVGYFFVNERNREFADVRYRLFEESEAIA